MRRAVSELAAWTVAETEGPGSNRRIALPGVLVAVTALVLGVLVGGAMTSSHPGARSVVELILPSVAPAQAVPGMPRPRHVRHTRRAARPRPGRAVPTFAVALTDPPPSAVAVRVSTPIRRDPRRAPALAPAAPAPPRARPARHRPHVRMHLRQTRTAAADGRPRPRHRARGHRRAHAHRHSADQPG
jgi:hypothetical protein